MDIFDVIEKISSYGVDIAFISVLTCVAVQILKRTALKNCQKKIITFLPFALGVVFYAIYAAIANWSVCYLVDELPYVCERGFTIGSLSTVVYVWYEQFVRESKSGSQTEEIVSTLIEGYVPADEVESAAKSIVEAIQQDVTGDGAKRAAEILAACAGEDVTERDITLLSKLIIETLAHLNCSSAQ